MDPNSDVEWAAARIPGWDVHIPTDDESITRRRRALAPIQVLTDIERTKNTLDGDHWVHYDLFRLALAVIDQVALAMGISAGRTWDETIAYATQQAARQRPDGNRTEWGVVAERVVVSLVTTDVEVTPYLVHTTTGPAWRQQRFRLLYLQAVGSEGHEHLRASEQAINIFVEALDLDIEAAQVANEAQLNALIARGAVESAVQIARHARYRSIQYQERVRRIVADTLIDPDVHDWVEDVPELLDAALAHVRARLNAESALLDAVADRRSELDDSTKIVAANQLIEILRECRRRHDDLHGHLISARSRLRAALDDRLSRPPRSVHRADIGRDLLDPYLGCPTARAAEVAERLVATVGGIATRWWPSVAVLTDELCALPRPPDPGEEYTTAEIDSGDEQEWWEPYEDTVDAILDGLTEPTRLSALLARADALAATTADGDGEPLDSPLLATAIVHAAHRTWTARLAGRSAGDRLVIGVTTGDALMTREVRSDDLLLVPGEVTADIGAPDVPVPVGRPDRDDRGMLG
jgi:hypothetical protein